LLGRDERLTITPRLQDHGYPAETAQTFDEEIVVFGTLPGR